QSLQTLCPSRLNTRPSTSYPCLLQKSQAAIVSSGIARHQNAGAHPTPDAPPDLRPLETVTETQLPDAHEAALRGYAAEARQIDGVPGRRTVELRRVGQVQQLDANLGGMVPREPSVVGWDYVDVLAELVARVAVRPRRVAVAPGTRILERRGAEPAGVGMIGGGDAFGVAARDVGIADRVGTLPASEQPQVGVGRAGAHHGVQRRAADQLDDRRGRPPAEQ